MMMKMITAQMGQQIPVSQVATNLSSPKTGVKKGATSQASASQASKSRNAKKRKGSDPKHKKKRGKYTNVAPTEVNNSEEEEDVLPVEI